MVRLIHSIASKSVPKHDGDDVLLDPVVAVKSPVKSPVLSASDDENKTPTPAAIISDNHQHIINITLASQPV